MKIENVKSVFVRLPEGREVPSKADILKNLASKDLKEKERALNFLIVNIINDVYYEQNIMAIINHVLPFQSKSVALKKLVLVYWEVIQKRRHNGVVLDEFLLVCNNLRNDLNHANEFVVGATLKLIGRIAIPEIIDSLLVPIYENGLRHIEPFVRRNAVECLFDLYLKFGEEVVHDLDEKMLEILAKESDTNTKRNALMLLFRVNPSAAVDYVSRALAAEGLESFSDIIQLVVVKNLFELCKKDPASKSKYLRLVLEFLASPFNSVQFEIANSVADFSASPNVIAACVHQLIRILQEIPDVSIKLIILQKLFFFKSLSAKYLDAAVPELLKLLETENTEVRIKTLKLVQNYITQGNIDDFLRRLKLLLQAAGDPSVNEKLNERLKKNLLKALIGLVRHRMNGKFEFKEDTFRDLFLFLIESDPKQPANVALLKTFLEMAFAARATFKTDLIRLSIQNFLGVQNPEVFSTLFTLVAQEVEGERQSEELLAVFGELGAALAEVARKTAGGPKEATEVKKVQTVKTVIREDGSYGTEIVEEVSGPAHSGLEYSRYKFLVAMLTTNSVFLINFLRNVTQLVRHLPPHSPDAKKTVAKFCQVVFTLYKMKQKETNKEDFVFIELNQLVRDMLSEAPAAPRLTRPKMSVTSVHTADLRPPTDKAASQFDQLLNFRVLRSPHQHPNARRLRVRGAGGHRQKGRDYRRQRLLLLPHQEPGAVDRLLRVLTRTRSTPRPS